MVAGVDIALGVAGLATSLPGLLDVIVRFIDVLLHRLQNYKDDYRKLIELIVRLNKSQTQDLFMFLNDGSNKIPEDLQHELLDLFQALRDIFEELLSIFPEPDTATRSSNANSGKITARRKRRADDAVRRLEDWNDHFFKRAIVFVLFGRRQLQTLLKVNGHSVGESHELAALRRVERLRDAIDESLGRAQKAYRLLLDRSESPETTEQLRYSSMLISKGSPSPVLVEYRTYSDDASERDVENHRRIVRTIACILHEADPQLMGILFC